MSLLSLFLDLSVISMFISQIQLSLLRNDIVESDVEHVVLNILVFLLGIINDSNGKHLIYLSSILDYLNINLGVGLFQHILQRPQQIDCHIRLLVHNLECYCDVKSYSQSSEAFLQLGEVLYSMGFQSGVYKVFVKIRDLIEFG